ncbi:MAG: hypothetical protein H7839_04465 [Magnetococcus sp. YQC-5]
MFNSLMRVCTERAVVFLLNRASSADQQEFSGKPMTFGVVWEGVLWKKRIDHSKRSGIPKQNYFGRRIHAPLQRDSWLPQV